MPILECNSLTKRFGSVEALTDVSFSVEQGDRIQYGTKRYRVRRAERVDAGGMTTHYWAVLDREEAVR